MVRAKFKCSEIKSTAGYTGQAFKFTAVTDSQTPENQKFSRYTPSGELTMFVDNPAAQAAFELGREYYLDFTPA